uniref:Uncharacterized protein n=1 Tax=Cynoglossus semilaevis TaxID=244447 RepID=A0A3P8WW26_CYNSE
VIKNNVKKTMTMKDNELYSFLQLCGAVQYLLSCFTASRGSARYGLCSNTVVLLFFLTMYSELKLPHLIVNNKCQKCIIFQYFFLDPNYTEMMTLKLRYLPNCSLYH